MSADVSDPERWQRIEKLFDRAIELEPSQRSAFLDTEARDADERREVAALLAAAENPGPLDAPVGELAQTLTREATDASGSTSPEEGKTVGAWRLLEPLGGGGMGRVFRAERRDGDFDQVAALKLLRWELASPALVERFKNERRILARLEHPGIARLIDGGVTEEGLPYLVMEHVDGRPIDRYCEEERLSLGARLELFLQVCDAVQAAHRRLVVHRDLKPSNILVTPRGRVKLLDFGVGKFLEASAGDELTRTHLAPATPGWAAPEQLTGGEVTTATDVYALGVLLYRLLTGSPPVEIDSADPAAIARAVLEIDPVPPSAQADGRRSAALRGDLDNITLTALRKEPERRYPSVDRLAADVRRYLDGRPVDATPETLRYRLGKFARRNRVGVVAACLVLVAILAGLAATTWQARKARREALTAQRVAAFLSSLFASANPYNREAGARTLEDVLRSAAERLETELRDEPEVRADLLAQIGIAHYRLLRQDERAWELLSDAERELSRFGESSQLAELWLEKAWLSFERSDGELQKELAERAQRAFALTDGPRSEGVARALVTRATAAHRIDSDLDEADRLASEALAILEELGDARSLSLGDCLAELAAIAQSSGQLERAADLMLRALEIFEEAGGERDPDVIALSSNLALIRHHQGRFPEAENRYRSALERQVTRFGDGHPDAASILTNLARLLHQQGRFHEALDLADRAAEAASALPDSNFERLAAEINQASAQLETGAVAEAESAYRSARARFVATLGEDHPAVARIGSLLADALLRRGEPSEAERLYRLALIPQNQNIDEAWLGLGRVLADTGRQEEAAEAFEKALERRERLPEGHWRIVEVEAELARLATAAEPGASARAALAEVVTQLEETLAPENWRFERLRGRPAD